MLIPALALALAVPAVGQVVPTVPSLGCTQPYYVQEGDNLWTLAEVRWRNPELWRWLVQQNPLLQEPGRFIERDGREIILIRPGETLYCLEEAGINIGSSNVAPSTPVGQDTHPSIWEEFTNWLGENWWWLLLLLLGGGFLLWLLRELAKDPVRSRAPQVTGGVSDQTVRDQFERRGTERNFTLVPGSIVRGRGYGRMMVSYYGGAERPRTLNGEPIYRATARYHDGREEDIYMLQGCGNDVTSGGAAYRLLSNFRFVEGEAVAESSTEPVMEAVTVPPAAPAEPTVDFDGELAPGTIQVSVQGPRSEGDKASLRVSGASLDGLSIQLSDRSLTVRWLPEDGK